jgi:predicted small lipoprotein YifL
MSTFRLLRLLTLALALAPVPGLAGCGNPAPQAIAPTGKDASDFYREQLKKDADRRALKAG